MKKVLILSLTVIFGFAIVMGCGQEEPAKPEEKAAAAPAPAKTTFVTIGTGGITGVYYPTGGAIAKIVNKKKDQYGILTLKVDRPAELSRIVEKEGADYLLFLESIKITSSSLYIKMTGQALIWDCYQMKVVWKSFVNGTIPAINSKRDVDFLVGNFAFDLYKGLR